MSIGVSSRDKATFIALWSAWVWIPDGDRRRMISRCMDNMASTYDIHVWQEFIDSVPGHKEYWEHEVSKVLDLLETA